jgi:anti-sigma regulatory factor (Ser/Thr protein kinase)
MNQRAVLSQSFIIKGGDFINAGTVSVKIKRLLKEIGLKPEIIYRTAICCYEAEMNVVMYAYEAVLYFNITSEEISINFSDKGPGIKDVELALKEGYSTATDKMREMGFGAGMGLPNIKNNADEFDIKSEVSIGTNISFKIYINGKHT